MKYAVFNMLGEIQWTGHCPESKVTLQGLKAKGHKSVEVPNEVTELTHYIVPSSGKPQLLSTATKAARQYKLDALDRIKPKPSKLERVLSYLKKKGLDLGPDGGDL